MSGGGLITDFRSARILVPLWCHIPAIEAEAEGRGQRAEDRGQRDLSKIKVNLGYIVIGQLGVYTEGLSQTK